MREGGKRPSMRQLFGILLLAAFFGCGGAGTQTNSLPVDAAPPRTAPNGNAAHGGAGVPVYGYEVVNTYPHDPGAFTQGLIFHEGALVESTGLERHSTLRRVELQT